MATANGAEGRTANANTLTEEFGTSTNKESIDKEHIIIHNISPIVTNNITTSPVITNISHTATRGTDWRLIHTPKQSPTTSQYQHNLDKANRSQSQVTSETADSHSFLTNTITLLSTQFCTTLDNNTLHNLPMIVKSSK